MATAISISSESSDHYLLLDDGTKNNQELYKLLQEKLGEELLWCDIDLLETTTPGVKEREITKLIRSHSEHMNHES